MPPHSTGHDYAAPAPYAKYEQRMRYPKRARSDASPRHDSRSLPPGVLPPGSPPPSVINPPPRYDNRPLPHGAINPPQVPNTVVTAPYVNHDHKMKYPKPALPAAMPRLDNVRGGCNKPGGCNVPAADKSPQVPTTMSLGERKPLKDGDPVVDQYGNVSPYNHANDMAQKAWWNKWMWPIACCVPVTAFGCILLCTAADVGSNKMRSKGGDEEEPEEEEEDEDEYESE